jgi:hypothetical protein
MELPVKVGDEMSVTDVKQQFAPQSWRPPLQHLHRPPRDFSFVFHSTATVRDGPAAMEVGPRVPEKNAKKDLRHWHPSFEIADFDA